MHIFNGTHDLKKYVALVDFFENIGVNHRVQIDLQQQQQSTRNNKQKR